MPTSDSHSAAAGSFNGAPWLWFLRAASLGVLVMAGLNAVSYFFRSSRWGSLVGRAEMNHESLGFPFVIWEAGNTYGGWYVDYRLLAANAAVALGVGSVFGWFTAMRSEIFNRWVESMLSEMSGDQHRPIQFSLRGLMIATGLVAVVATIARHVSPRPETLLAIYALGPALLVAIAMLPRRLSWQKRVIIIVPLAYALIAAAIAVGIGIGMEFDQVLMGIFLCWTPQSVLAAVVLILAIFVSRTLNEPSTKEGSR